MTNDHPETPELQGELHGAIQFCDHHREPTTDFPYDQIEIDRGNPLAAELERSTSTADIAEAFGEVLRWCWVGADRTKGTDRWRNPQSAYNRFLAVSAATLPDLLNGASYEALGREVGLTKAMVSRIALDFQDHFAVHFRRSRREGTRQKFREAHLGKHRNV